MDVENIDTKLKINDALGKYLWYIIGLRSLLERNFSAGDGTKKIDERIDQK